MLVSYTWPVEEPTSGGGGSGGGSGVTAAIARSVGAAFDPYGSGIIRPFHRVSSDFASASGIPEVMSCVGQVLGTDLGSLPWRPGFGTRLTRLRHKANRAVLVDIARVDVETALRTWEPRATLTSLTVEQIKSPGHSTGNNELSAVVTIQIGAQSLTLRVPI